MTERGAIDKKFKDAFPAGGDRSKDFVEVIQTTNSGSRDFPEEIPPIFPQPERIKDRPIGEPAPDPNRDLLQKKDLTAKYARFNMGDPDDVRRLEDINNKVLKEGWMLAREEWVHTKDGKTFVLLKYLESKPKKTKQPTTKTTTNADGSKSAPVTQ
jgi:hypothetical protein